MFLRNYGVDGFFFVLRFIAKLLVSLNFSWVRTSSELQVATTQELQLLVSYNFSWVTTFRKLQLLVSYNFSWVTTFRKLQLLISYNFLMIRNLAIFYNFSSWFRLSIFVSHRFLATFTRLTISRSTRTFFNLLYILMLILSSNKFWELCAFAF